MPWVLEKTVSFILIEWEVKKIENTVNARFTQGLFWKLIKFFTQSYLSLLNSFSFLSRFSVSLKSLNNYFFRRFAYMSLLNRLSVLINYIMGSSNQFFYIQLFPTFFRVEVFRVQVFQGPGFSRSRFFWAQVFQGQDFSGSRFFCKVFNMTQVCEMQDCLYN